MNRTIRDHYLPLMDEALARIIEREIIPSKFKYLAVDSDGCVFAYTHTPITVFAEKRNEGVWDRREIGDHQFEGETTLITRIGETPTWQLSLRKI